MHAKELEDVCQVREIGGELLLKPSVVQHKNGSQTDEAGNVIPNIARVLDTQSVHRSRSHGVSNICYLFKAGYALDKIDAGWDVMHSNLLPTVVKEEVAIMIRVQVDVASAILITSHVSKPDIITLGSCYDCRRLALVRKEAITRVSNPVLEENWRRLFKFIALGEDSE